MESSGRTLVCSVRFLDIVEYSKKPVADQLQLKQEFNRVLSKSLEQVPARDRIILDTGDGAAVTFMGDPEDALFAAMAVRDSAGAVAVRLGVSLGQPRRCRLCRPGARGRSDGALACAQRAAATAPLGFARGRGRAARDRCRRRWRACLARTAGARAQTHSASACPGHAARRSACDTQ